MLLDNYGKVIKEGQTILIPPAAAQTQGAGLELIIEEVGQTSTLSGKPPNKFIKGIIKVEIPLPINMTQLPGIYVVKEAEAEAEEAKPKPSLLSI